jgi:hypothetical protein
LAVLIITKMGVILVYLHATLTDCELPLFRSLNPASFESDKQFSQALTTTNDRNSSMSRFAPPKASDVVATKQLENLSSVKGKDSSERDSRIVPDFVDAAHDIHFVRRSEVGSVPTMNVPIEGADSSGLNHLTNYENSPSKIDADRTSIPPAGRERSSSAPPAEDSSANAQRPSSDELPRAGSLYINSITPTDPNTSPPVASGHQGTLPTFNNDHHELSTSRFPNQEISGVQSTRETPNGVSQGSRFELFDRASDSFIALQTNIPDVPTVLSTAHDDESGDSLTDGSPIEVLTWQETVFDSVKIQSVNDKPRA